VDTTNVIGARRETQILTTCGMNPLLRALDLSVSIRGDETVLGGYVQLGLATRSRSGYNRSRSAQLWDSESGDWDKRDPVPWVRPLRS